MGTRDYASNPADLGEGTVVELFFAAVDRLGDRTALRFRDGSAWKPISYDDVQRRVYAASRALASLGLERGDRVAILSHGRPEWAFADYGCLTAGVIDVPIYASLTAPQIAFILQDSGARLIFVADESQLAKIEEIRPECAQLEWAVVFDPPDDLPAWALSWAAFLARAEGDFERDAASFRAAALKARPSDVATILYTSGTTGEPKGVMLTHNNLHANVRACATILPIDHGDSSLSFLPLSHALQRTIDFLFFSLGCSISYARSVHTVTEDLRTSRPTFVVSVPRLYEKVYATVMDASGLRGLLVDWARAVGTRWADRRLGGDRPGLWTRMQYAVANRLVFRRIREATGGRLRYFVSGGAPLSPEIARFFFSAGLVILEGYGLTETSPVTNVNTPNDFPAHFRIGTVGQPIPGTEEKIAEDGEILIRGPQVMKGYYNRPDLTEEAITPDRWFRTGDIGEIDEDGFLRITDRKKDLIVTAGGKKVAPQPIENTLKANRYVDQPVLVGDGRKFVSLLLVPDFEALEAWARMQGMSPVGRGELLADAGVQKFLEGEVLGGLTDLASFELPKKILLLEREFSIEDGSLTPTQKVKRRVVEERYREAIDALYQESSEHRTVFTAAETRARQPKES